MYTTKRSAQLESSNHFLSTTWSWRRRSFVIIPPTLLAPRVLGRCEEASGSMPACLSSTKLPCNNAGVARLVHTVDVQQWVPFIHAQPDEHLHAFLKARLPHLASWLRTCPYCAQVRHLIEAIRKVRYHKIESGLRKVSSNSVSRMQYTSVCQEKDSTCS